jgi:hypothetical protein
MAQLISPTHDLDRETSARLVMDLLHRIVIHYGLWFTEVRHQMGPEKALETLAAASGRSLENQLGRLARVMGFDMRDGLPAPLLDLPADRLNQLMEAVATNWLANDGVWFQAVEFSSGMNDAKRCNDSCWAHFSPFEAWSIRRFLNLADRPGLDGLKQALGYRLYAVINTQSIVEETHTGFVFQMNSCRVQAARQRKGLADYPCKSAGLVEYTYFARSVDPRIQTECVCCPPDDHPDDCFCAWRFTLVPD